MDPVGSRSDPIDLTAEQPFRVGAATIDPVSREADYPGGKERLQPQNLKVLVALSRRRGKAVTRQELIDWCWDGRIIGEDVINRAISLLRDFASRAGGFTIETIPKSGYRLVESDVPPRRPGSRWPLAAALVVALMVIGGALLWLGPRYRQGKPPMPTVTLLPIAFDASDPRSRALALATGDSLTHLLRDSGFATRRLSARPVDGKSQTDLIIDGSIRSGRDGPEADVRVEETRHGTIIFSKRLSSSWADSSALPDRVAARIATNLNWTGALMILDRRRPTDPRIVAELLKQVSMIVEDGDYLRAYEISRRIAPQAPDSAIAQVSLAFNTGFLINSLPRAQKDEALARGRAAADRARALAPEFGDAYVPWCLLNSPVRKIECETRMRDGLRADPDAPFVAAFLANFLHGVGRTEEAVGYAREALADDPYKPAKMTLLLRLLEATGEVGEADELYRRIFHYWPDYPGLEWSRATGILERNDFAALAAFKRSLPDPKTRKHRMSIAFADVIAADDRAGARRLCPAAQIPEGTGGQCMIALSAIGDLDGAFAIADTLYPDLRAASGREKDRLWLDWPLGAPESFLTGPSGAALRRDRRFLLLADRIGLLSYWRSGRLPDFCRGRPEPVCVKIAPRRR
jgi:DNA-binding winged helix-turn-helix (wHTH) protein/tetratricopeptide (TPR) repeat protein